MKKILFLSLILIVLVSGCIDFGGGSQASFGISEITNNPDIYLKVETSADNIKAGREMQVKTIIENKGSRPLESINVTAYDLCLFIGDNKKELEELKANRTNQWTWKWKAGETQFERDCDVKFLTEYMTEAYSSKTINVLQESEYYTRETQQTLNQIPVMSYSTDNSLQITMSFSEEQPFLEGEEIYVYINYADVGNGILKQVEAGKLIIDAPGNLINGECSGYDFDGEKFVLSSPLKFVSKKAPATSCKFITKANQLIDSRELAITATYKYQFYNSLLLGVRP